MRQFYLYYPKGYSLSSQLTWTHWRALLRVQNEVTRQKRISFGDKHFYIDLVFYNIPARCYVLIDLKIDELTHQDLGQMQMYVNYYTREMMNPGDNPPVGIVLCAEKNDTVVKYTLPEGENHQCTFDNGARRHSQCLNSISPERLHKAGEKGGEDDQFGFEKPFFLEENFIYSANDCEDRSILFSFLHNGRRFTICDPTYIGAPVGMAMEDYRDIEFNVLTL
ncbi:MAG: PDDEXK nuclease domain-containing protein [Candidatus Cryptobacteroides sp.]